MTTETVTGPFLLVLTSEQIPLLNDCLYEGFMHSEPGSDGQDMIEFRADLTRQLNESPATIEALRRVREELAAYAEVPEEGVTALYICTQEDLDLFDALLGATP